MTVDDLEAGLARLHECLSAAERAGKPEAAGANIFEVLAMLPREPAHSAMLAWLLDPEACHGLGDSFLRAFWLRLLGQCPVRLTPVLVSRKRPRTGERTEILLIGPDWQVTIEVIANAPGTARSTAATPGIAWRVFAASPAFAAREAPRATGSILTAHLLPAA